MRPQMGYYDSIIEEAAALLESLAMNHPFVDGNKRNRLLRYRHFPAQERQLHRLRQRRSPPLLHAAPRDPLVPVRGASLLAGGARQAAARALRRQPIRKVNAELSDFPNRARAANMEPILSGRGSAFMPKTTG